MTEHAINAVNAADETLPNERGGGLSRALSATAAFLSRRGSKVHTFVWMLYDAGLAAVGLRLAYLISPKVNIERLTWHEVGIFVVATIVCAHISGMYEKQVFNRGSRLFMSVGFTALVVPVLVTLVFSFERFRPLARYIFVLWACFFYLAALSPRAIIFLCSRFHPLRILLVGEYEVTRMLAKRLRRESGRCELVGFCVDEARPDVDVLGSIIDIPRVCRERRVDQIVISGRPQNASILLENCFEAAKEGCSFEDACSFHEEMFEQVSVDLIDEEWFLRSNIHLSRRFQSLIKRGLDIILSLVGLVLLAPLFPFIYALIRLSSWGPAFYIQTRSGQFGRPFNIYKFRTMSMNAEQNGAQWAAKNDARVTPIGYLLRKTRLDEVPQFLNILKGDMSFVGPRPERPEMVREIEKEVPFFTFRCWARPGLTGLAQIRYGYGATIKEAKQKLQYDLFYIKNWSILLDLKIILRTLATVMSGAR